MWLTKNEKKVLNLLIDNAKLSDTSIANDLKISSQAVGKIRRRLEEDVIQGYTLNLDSKMLGLEVIAIIKMNFHNCEDKNLLEIEEGIKKLTETFFFLKTISGEKEHILVAGFKNLEDLEKFINEKKKISIYNCCEIKEVVTIPSNCVLKNSNKELYKKLIESSGIKNNELNKNQ